MLQPSGSTRSTDTGGSARKSSDHRSRSAMQKILNDLKDATDVANKVQQIGRLPSQERVELSDLLSVLRKLP